MKRKIVVEIDCEETVCGDCEHNNGDYCSIFNDELEWDGGREEYLRCMECLNAEVEE
jgi:hypothetical protein